MSDCEHSNDIQRLNKEIFGNGKPQHSMIVRVGNIEKRTVRIERIGYIIIAGVLMAVFNQFTDRISFDFGNQVPHANIIEVSK